MHAPPSFGEVSAPNPKWLGLGGFGADRAAASFRRHFRHGLVDGSVVSQSHGDRFVSLKDRVGVVGPRNDPQTPSIHGLIFLNGIWNGGGGDP